MKVSLLVSPPAAVITFDRLIVPDDVSDNAPVKVSLADVVIFPADVIVKLGRRTFMSYLTKPFTDRAAMSLKER